MRQVESTEDQIYNWAASTYGATPSPVVAPSPAPAPAPVAAPVATPSPASSTPATASTWQQATSTPAAAAAPAPASTWSAATASTPTAIAAPAPKAEPSPAPAPAAVAPAAPSTWAQAAAPTPAPAAAPAKAANIDINSWYRNELGRDGDAAGIAFWQKALDGGADPQQLYNDFAQASKTNQEQYKPVDWASANTYTGPVSSNPNSMVDEWGTNVLGRPLTAAEQTQWDAQMNAATTPEAAKAVYQQFLAANAGSIKNPLTMAQASQIAAPAAGTPAAVSPAASAVIAGTSTTAPQIDTTKLATRDVKPNETVQGQLSTILGDNSPVLQQARADAMRAAADRGMLNSTMAASGGEDATIRSATGIATSDAGTYNNAANYNTAAINQGIMWNADQVAQLQRLQQQLADSAAARAQSMSIAQMQDATSRYQSELSNATSKYNTDKSYQQQADAQKTTLVNNIMNNMELSPDRKAAMLEALGEGTSAKQNADGSYSAGTGLAGAVYVIGSTSADLQYNPTASAIYPNATGPVGSAINNAAAQVAANSA